MKRILLITLTLIFMVSAFSQEDKAVYKDRINGFYQDSIQSGIKDFENNKNKKSPKKYLSVDFSEYDFPTDINDYNPEWHNNPLSQGSTGTCWCFAGISFLESEIYRQTGQEIKLSEMYIVYWEYVARAEYFVEHRGEMYFGQGSETNAVIKNMKKHGLVPAGQYTGLLEGQRFFDHSKMAKEIKSYFDYVKENNLWDKTAVVNNVKSILNHYMTAPPTSINIKDNKLSPLEYMTEVTQLNPYDYFCFMSTISKTYNQKGELEEPDNWWHDDNYYNLELDDFISVLTHALENGYTLSICGDVSEPGYDKYEEVGIIPDFDIPEKYINADSREFRINNGSSTDDHCIHLVGLTKKDGQYWFMIKDSSSSGFDGPNKGYRFIREDYARLKILAIMVHKYGAKNVLDKIIK